MLLGLLAATDEPIAGGRHKVFGHHDLAVIPQTSTIASHLPRALGVAFAIGRARKLGAPIAWPDDALVVCSFGDASANHSTATGAINTAVRVALPAPAAAAAPGLRGQRHRHQRAHAARLDRGTPTATGPTSATRSVDGTDPAATFDVAASWRRGSGASSGPAFLHLRTVRFGGHAGSDVEAAYRKVPEIRDDYAPRPAARHRPRCWWRPAWRRRRSWSSATSAVGRTGAGHAPTSCSAGPTLTTAAEVMAPLAPRRPDAVAAEVAASAAPRLRADGWSAPLPEDEGPLTLAQSINRDARRRAWRRDPGCWCSARTWPPRAACTA